MPGRFNRLLPVLLHIAGRVRLTLGVLVVILIAGAILQAHAPGGWPQFAQRYGWDLTTVKEGRLYDAWVGLFFSTSPLDFYGILILVSLTLGVLEYRRGTVLAAFSFLAIGPIASIITLLVLWPLSNAGIEYVRVALYTPDSGASTACLVCLGVFLSGEKGVWRNILIIVVLIILGGLFYKNRVFNFDHLDGYLIGLLSGFLLNRYLYPKAP